MRETRQDIAALQELMDATYEAAESHLLSIVTSERRLSAAQVVAYLQGLRHIALATVSADCRPFVGMVDAYFLLGRFHFGTAAGSMRTRHISRNPSVSATHAIGDEVAITVHGTAVLLERGSPGEEALLAAWHDQYGTSPYELGDVALYEIVPRRMYAYAPDPSAFPTSQVR